MKINRRSIAVGLTVGVLAGGAGRDRGDDLGIVDRKQVRDDDVESDRRLGAVWVRWGRQG